MLPRLNRRDQTEFVIACSPLMYFNINYYFNFKAKYHTHNRSNWFQYWYAINNVYNIILGFDELIYSLHPQTKKLSYLVDILLLPTAQNVHFLGINLKMIAYRYNLYRRLTWATHIHKKRLALNNHGSK